MQKDIQYYQNLIYGLHIIKGSLFSRDADGYSYSVSGPHGGMYFVKSLDYFEKPENVEEIKQQLKPYHRHLELRKIYPYLYISNGAVWILSTSYPEKDGIGVRLDKKIEINNEPHELLKELNEEGKFLHEDPKNRFFCTICKKTYHKESLNTQQGVSVPDLLNIRINKYGDSLWAGAYCDICIENDKNLKEEIHRSKTDPKYYD